MTNVFRVTWCNTFDTFYPLKRMIRVCFILLCQQYYVKSSVSSFTRSIYSHCIGCRAEPQFGYFCFSVKHTHNLLKLSSIILRIVLETRGGKFDFLKHIFIAIFFTWFPQVFCNICANILFRIIGSSLRKHPFLLALRRWGRMFSQAKSVWKLK